MAITTTAMTLGPEVGDHEWGVIFCSADLSGGEDIKAAVTGAHLCIDEFYIHSDADVTVDIGSAQDTGVTTALLTGIGMVDGGNFGPVDFRGQRCVISTAFSIDASGAANITGYVTGHTEYP